MEKGFQHIEFRNDGFHALQMSFLDALHPQSFFRNSHIQLIVSYIGSDSEDPSIDTFMQV